jgi:hypothetical protein
MFAEDIIEMAEESPAWKWLRDIAFQNTMNLVTEIHALIPDSLLFGSLLLYLLTHNLSFGIFAVFIVESVMAHRMISWVSSQSTGPSRPIDVGCRAGFKNPRTDTQRAFQHDPYPSYSIFSITSVATYMALATRQFASTLDAMGSPDWSSRSLVSYISIAALLLLFVLVRLWSCDTTGEILTAMVLAIIVGSVFFGINKAVFGEEAMNFLGLPYLVSKESKGEPIYVCSTTGR